MHPVNGRQTPEVQRDAGDSWAYCAAVFVLQRATVGGAKATIFHPTTFQLKVVCCVIQPPRLIQKYSTCEVGLSKGS